MALEKIQKLSIPKLPQPGSEPGTSNLKPQCLPLRQGGHLKHFKLSLDCNLTWWYRGRRKMGGHSRPLRCGSERKKQNASYVLMVFQPRNGADSFGSQFDGRKEIG
ncbi:jg27545 [Pararge aegeria aegeria]|uniref:Jg27545 protein n=1 Tax=Pararge aegeria aegeria TaxID=348720 RepID=A0A8S4SFF2_9NEOP|nr:jg27545 [Pararge aegeria aegeria]